MVSWGLVVTAGLALAAATAYLAVGLFILRRSPSKDVQAANTAFGAGWLLFAAVLASDAVRVALGLIDPVPTTLYLALVEVKIILTAAALAAMGTYVLYMWSGRKWIWMPMVVAGLGHAFFFLTVTLASLPMTVEVGRWATRLDVAGTVDLPGGRLMGIALFFLPFVALVVLYLLLWGKVHTRTQRYRLLAVGLSLLMFLAAASVQSNPDVSPDTPTLPVVWLIILVAGVFSLWAFEPPAWLRARFSIQPVQDEGQPRFVARRST